MVSDSKCSFTNSDDDMKPTKLDLNSNSGFNTPGEIKSNHDLGLKRRKNCKTPTERPKNAVEAIQ